ncbi:type II toxin-antitoxin system RelE/ParE family toxin [Phormidium tenue]|uniref:Plasmid stabilization protein n=1 Tax=Phormidium tenue NIES-30 TaxID=549789 RepID=A0A1U7J9G2_9CYAN|nr:type II toxin-antitoxin system RelE/ParE family toxin [Phormidium tenue]MBD2230841.1 type II toxin-antitoxin system RelE/ParE family toxin [Phormidium tenue FACHB-1052]OKH50112.1 plasmid stabilization protein [Phormidium tenue NIES-30]
MPPQFYLTQPAIQDIEAIADYIAGQTGLQQAERFLSKLDAKFVRITQFPNLGRPRDEILPELRSLSMESYLILYTSTESRVDILRVVSGYRNLTSLFTDDEE